MEELHSINYLDDSGESTSETLIQMAEALRDAIPRDKARINSFRVLDYLARRTIELVREGKEPLIPTKDIHIDLAGNPNQDPSAWLSPLWTAIEKKFYDQIEATVIERCRERGLSQYPRPARQRGSPALYRLEGSRLDASQEHTPISEASVDTRRSHRTASYQQDLTLKLSSLGRFIFGRGLAWTRSKKLILVALILCITLVLIVVIFVGYAALGQSHSPLSAADVVAILVFLGGPWVVMRWLDKQMRFFDDRIVIAPDWALAWKEFGATLELEGEPESGGTRAIKVVRYTAPCPICDGMLKLDRGEPDFPRRVVGRCSKSPREHVYSFDRITLQGAALNSPT